mgnify:CR=1 FL=1
MKFLFSSVLLFITTVCMAARPSTTEAQQEAVHRFIQDSWEKTVRFHTEDEGIRIGLPYRYTVPSINGAFQEMYYWDTYFTGEGLILDGHVDLAKNNADNMLYMVDRFGKMYNGNLTVFQNRSQPPYLSMMIASVYRKTGDKEWLKKILPTLEKEYQFWMTRRITPIGLNRYGNEATEQDKAEFIGLLRDRLRKDFPSDTLPVEEKLKISSHFIAEAESGWDFNPRFHSRCMDFCPLDLNANLYLYEKNFAYFASELGDKQAAKQWTKKAEARKKLIRKYCRDPKTDMYYDYDYVNGRRSDVLSGAVFSLLYTGAVPREYAGDIVQALVRLEFPYGIAACEDKPYDYPYQWSYPNTWPPVCFYAVMGLARYGYGKEAERIAVKWMKAVTESFKTTGNLWEKYNVETGTTDVSNEYEMPAMLGWTAGTFICLDDYLAGEMQPDPLPSEYMSY